MKWLTNIPDPNNKDIAYWALQVPVSEKRSEVWEKHLDWLEGKTIGDPKGSSEYSVARRKQAGWVGVYEVENKDGEK